MVELAHLTGDRQNVKKNVPDQNLRFFQIFRI
jgi:hypothetical protein